MPAVEPTILLEVLCDVIRIDMTSHDRESALPKIGATCSKIPLETFARGKENEKRNAHNNGNDYDDGNAVWRGIRTSTAGAG